MAAVSSGVYPCYENQFKFENNTIANCESFSVSLDNGVEEWYAFDQEGWVSRLLTAKAITISVTAKRTIGDSGNDAIAALSFAKGQAAQGSFTWTFPDGTVVTFANAVVNVTNPGSGDSTAVAPLEFDIMSNGAPTVTPAA